MANSMNFASTGGFHGKRRPWRGLILLGSTFILSTALSIYISAWAASERISARSLLMVDTPGAIRTEGKSDVHDISSWWENGVLYLCPLH